ncbi:MAG: terminase [Acidobacteriaceae bacterium]
MIGLGKQLDAGNDAALALAEKVLTIRNRLGRNVALAANPAQRMYEENAGRRNIVLKARQMGVSTWIAGQFFLHTITHPGTVTVQVAHTQEAAEQIFRIVHRFLALLPESLRDGALKSAQKSAQRIVFPGIDSEYLVETAGDRNAGRGLTITNLHCTELARWPGDAAETLYGLLATLSPAGQLALESTPMGADGCFWKEWQEAEKTNTVRHFFPWWLEPAYVAAPPEAASLTDAEQQLMREHGLLPEQIGYRRQIQRNFRGLAKQEYAEDPTACFLASGDCFFETGAIDARLGAVQRPVAERHNGALHIWLTPQAGREYLVAVDPAGGGVSGDFTAIQIIDLQSGLQCAEWRSRLTPLETAQEAAALAREYHGALLAVERNNQGEAVLAHLRATCRYHRIFQEQQRDGWLTTSLTRPQMLGKLSAALVEAPDLFSSERLLRECRSFVRQASGRAEAQAGEHDDCVLAMALALAVREEKLTAKRGAVA